MIATETVNLLAGLSWDPAIRGILTVVLGVAILMGSTFVILATNTGVRLGLLLSLAGLFGWMAILTLTWWIQPPGIGPSGGVTPKWEPVEILLDGTSTAKTDAVLLLPSKFASAADVIATCPNVANLTPKSPVLSDVASVTTTCEDGRLFVGKREVPQRADLGQWKIIPTSEAGESQTAADAALIAQGVFDDATEYKKLDVFDFGGNPTLEDDCPDSGGTGAEAKTLVPATPLCRFTARITKTFRLWHPPHYALVQVQPVIVQEAKAGEPPPIPVIDESKPVVSVVLIRNQGNIRAKPAAFFFICTSLFVYFCLHLHFRDKNEWANRARTVAKVEG